MPDKVPFFTLFESFQAPRQLRLLLHDTVALGGVLAVRSARKAKKSGKCIGCSGGCAGCVKCDKNEEKER